ncbi:hypothetical protein ASPZODRAFT_136337 [Penicilliopsis zonata CBS 506.65]|uniref:Elongator complex protein 6 n=1 Tax=Penicilliopsis zonata CBS 506.65 TaxID=1073090 RepID=A0A1L9S8H6_9EURO|nr:hypothetical protein ASPZODRAFT_136337 [Penicilliopsis zonata CBS 506.65]OJJ43462.1 hypothetical protein ASPZODRAFT_136337 [Penicilliopsis zonata CBS 506.65]
MPSQAVLPPLLKPYISSPSPSSLTVISSVLGATGNWLVLRFIYATLATAPYLHDASIPRNEKRKVVLVSFLRGWDFWRGEAKRLGLDLTRLQDKSQFAFVDGLSELFSVSTRPAPSPTPVLPGSAAPRTTLPVRSAPGVVPPRSGLHPALGTSTASINDGPTPLRFSGRGTTALDGLERDILRAVDRLKSTGSKDQEEQEEVSVLLIVDQPDLVLAATGPALGIGASEMGEWLLGLQQHVHSTVMTVSADTPLIHNASTFASQQPSPLETAQAAFVTGSAHRAETVIQLRNLETGAAKDVSGVLRISKGGAWEESCDQHADSPWEEREVLYFMQRDGGVRVFGRGE